MTMEMIAMLDVVVCFVILMGIVLTSVFCYRKLKA
jgi:hypothetical protein